MKALEVFNIYENIRKNYLELGGSISINVFQAQKKLSDLVERDTPKKVIVSHSGYRGSEFLEPPEFVCSVCKQALHISFTFCPYCGQRITYNDY